MVAPCRRPQATGTHPGAFLIPSTRCSCCTPGTTGKPIKGIMHTSGGYSPVSCYTMRTIFDQADSDVFGAPPTSAGSITLRRLRPAVQRSHGSRGHAPIPPTDTGILQIIEKYGVTIYYTASPLSDGL